MTTKNRIIFGFVCVTVIIVVISVLGYRTLDHAVTGYEEYRGYARLNVQSSDTAAVFNAGVLAMNLFLAGYDDSFV
jgi:hypothetical protein